MPLFVIYCKPQLVIIFFEIFLLISKIFLSLALKTIKNY